jgi:hypothetical protein
MAQRLVFSLKVAPAPDADEGEFLRVLLEFLNTNGALLLLVDRERDNV